MVELSKDDKYLRCKGCPKHATKDVHFENMKAAALEKRVLSVEFNAIRLKNTRASHVREKKIIMRGRNDKVLSFEGEINRPLGYQA